MGHCAADRHANAAPRRDLPRPHPHTLGIHREGRAERGRVRILAQPALEQPWRIFPRSGIAHVYQQRWLERGARITLAEEPACGPKPQRKKRLEHAWSRRPQGPGACGPRDCRPDKPACARYGQEDAGGHTGRERADGQHHDSRHARGSCKLRARPGLVAAPWKSGDRAVCLAWLWRELPDGQREAGANSELACRTLRTRAGCR
jgi:hypothetical protein